MCDFDTQGETGSRKSSYEQHHQDSAWKDIIEELFEDFLSFFFPQIYAEIDFSKGYTFLDKELQKLLKGDEVGKRYADKLVKVYLDSWEEKWLLIHVEVRGYKEEDFTERIYIYNYRIFDRYRKEVISAVILTDTDAGYRPNRYLVKRWGFKHEMEFILVKLIDYRGRTDELEKSSNPFALVVKAFLRYIEEKGELKRVYEAKRQLLNALFEENYSKRCIYAIFRFIDWLLQLPRELERRLEDELLKSTGGKSMPYITSWERMAKERGMEEGRKEGKKEGKKEGREEAKLEDAKKMFEEGLDMALIRKITGLPEEKLARLINSEDKPDTR